MSLKKRLVHGLYGYSVTCDMRFLILYNYFYFFFLLCFAKSHVTNVTIIKKWLVYWLFAVAFILFFHVTVMSLMSLLPLDILLKVSGYKRKREIVPPLRFPLVVSLISYRSK